MGVCVTTSVSLVAVAMLVVVNGNLLDTVQQGLNKLEKVASQGMRHLPGDLTRWTHLGSVKKMSVDAPIKLLSSQRNKQHKQSPALISLLYSGFSWKSCGPADQLVEIRNLSVTPSPLYFPGKLSFGFDVLFHDSIQQNAKVSASLILQYSATGSTWIQIPCIGQIGSCTYDDVCSLSKVIVCPDELKQRGIPCTCPIHQGEYILPNMDVDVYATVFIPGDYQAKVTFNHSVKGQIACYQVTFSVG